MSLSRCVEFFLRKKMDILTKTINQMFVVFVLIAIGYVLKKRNIVDDRAHANLSRMELFVFAPALNLASQIENCNVQTLKDNAVLIIYGISLAFAAALVAGPVSKLFVRDHKAHRDNAYARNIYRYALTFANYGFLGNFLIKEVWGLEMLFKYSMFTFGMAIFSNSWGLYILIPKDRNQSVLKNIQKGVLSPPVIALVIGMIIGLLNLGQYIPPFMNTVIDNASNCMGPIAMLLAGMVIGNYELKGLFDNIKVYIITAMRLIIIPALMIIVLKLLGVSGDIIVLSLVAFACPIGLNTIVFPAAYEGDTKMGASMVLISSFLAVITIPLMYWVFVILL